MKIPSPNYTQIPNILLDKWMRELPSSDFLVILAICRKTFGWHKEKDAISSNQLAEITGLSRRQVIDSVKRLQKLGTIQVAKSKNQNGGANPNLFELVIDEGVMQKLHGGSAEIALGVVQNPHQGGSAEIAPTKERVNTKEKRKTLPSAVALELSALLLQNLRNLNPGFKEPDLRAWGRDMELLIRIDKRDPEEIRKLIAWIAKDPFWQKIILSASKLRKQFDAIWMKAKLPKSNLEANKRLASDLKAERIEAEYLEIKADHVLDARLGKDLSYSNPNFAEILCGWYHVRLDDGQV